MDQNFRNATVNGESCTTNVGCTPQNRTILISVLADAFLGGPSLCENTPQVDGGNHTFY